MQEPFEQRCAALTAELEAIGALAVAFSGGVDSTVLLHAAHAVLGERVVAVLADSPSLPRSELADARASCATIGARLVVVATEELTVEGYRRNEGLRCYWCRHTLFEAMEEWARSHDFDALAYGEITDDLTDHRPGRVAAGEFGVLAPLRVAGFTKADVRRYAREHGLAVWDKPAAACLASRIPTGTPVSVEELGRIERAEEDVRALGFRVLRVRNHGKRARVEVGADEIDRAHAHRGSIAACLARSDFESIELAVYGER